MTTPEQYLEEADAIPSMLDEKKYLEERKRRLEASLHDHVAELRERGRDAGRVALIGAGAILGIWALAKTVGALTGSRKQKADRALKERVPLATLGPAAAPAAGPATSSRRPAAPPPPPPTYAPQSPEPSIFQLFIQSDAGKMLTNQMVAMLMVFVTKKLQDVLQLDGSADIGAVKESELARYRRTEPEEATVIDDSAAPDPAFRNAPNRPPVV